MQGEKNRVKIGNSTTTNRYAYNDLDWLTTETISGAATSSATFKYDLAGNWTNTVVNSVTNNYTYSNGCDRLVSWGKPNESKAWYNAAGCVTTLQYAATNKLFLTWDSEYRLTAVATGAASVVVERSGYDALNRRTWSYGLDGTVTNFFVHSGADLIADIDKTGGLRRAYVYGPGIDNILAMTVYTGTTVKTYFYLKDMQGTVHGVTDSTGTNIVERYIFDAWGKVLGVYNGAGAKIAQSAIGNRFLWQGREYSWRTGLYYFRTRHYIPTLGRWASKDMIGVEGGLNLYQAFGNAPTVNIDPLGLWTIAVGGGLNASLIASTSLSFQFTLSGTDWNWRHWNLGLAGAYVPPGAVLSSGIGLSGCLLFSWSAVDDPEEWGHGWSSSFGGSVSVAGCVIGYDVTKTMDECGNAREMEYWKHDFGFGFGGRPTFIPPELLLPFEFHAGKSFGGGHAVSALSDMIP